MNCNLASIPLFSGMSNEGLALLSGQLQYRNYARNCLIIAEGEHSDSLYIINKGQIKIFISDDEGQEMILNTLGPGDYFGELAIIDQKPRSASAMAVCDSDISVISSNDLTECLNHHPEMTIKLLQVMAKRLRDATESQRQLALMDVYGRLKVTLMALSYEADGIYLVEPKPRQQDIANMIGASREMVSRIFKKLKIDGYIETSKTSITIKKTLPGKW